MQIFSPKGEYLREWTFLNRPYGLFIDDQDMVHVAEGGFLNYMHKRAEGPLPAHDQAMICPPEGHSPIARVTVCDPEGTIAAQIGGENPILPGNFVAPHGLWADSRGDLYVGEVIRNAGAVKLHGALDPPRIPEVPQAGGLAPRNVKRESGIEETSRIVRFTFHDSRFTKTGTRHPILI